MACGTSYEQVEFRLDGGPDRMLTALATGTVTAGLSRFLGTPGLGLAGLSVVLLNLISSGGPAGQEFLPDAYRALSPWMPAGQLFSAFRGALYFEGQGVAAPVLVLAGWLVRVNHGGPSRSP